MESKFWEDVEAGETLPVLEFPITVKTLILAVCGTRDLMPYHHDPEYSKSVGNRDMFVNTMFEQALFGRYATDFAGPESDFRETGLQMLNQLCPGDVARIEGTVTEKLEEGGEKRIKLQISATNHIGIAATGTATAPSSAAAPQSQSRGWRGRRWTCIRRFRISRKNGSAKSPRSPREAIP